MLSKFGQLVRKLRIDRQMKLGEMAVGLGVSSAYLSALENNKKKLTNDFVERVVEFFDVSDKAADEIRDAAALSKEEFVLKPKKDSEINLEAVAMFARSIESSSLSEEKAKKILDILKM
ncbi:MULTISPECIES: helix-turn-helix domain-containing protein [Alteromonas]|uniref:helix-turn-helix domain-containing protein n=1 Tax=Alteromonas TaxID=226 RepID=UPI003519A225